MVNVAAIVIGFVALGIAAVIVSDRSEDELVSELGAYRLAYAAVAVFGGLGSVLLTVGSGVV